MSDIICPQCLFEYPYPQGVMWVCSDCGHEWNPEEPEVETEADGVVLDANGAPLVDGDSVVVIKDLKVKGSSNALKVGTKVKRIRIIDEMGDGHNISCSIPGFGQMYLKSSIVKKSK